MIFLEITYLIPVFRLFNQLLVKIAQKILIKYNLHKIPPEYYKKRDENVI